MLINGELNTEQHFISEGDKIANRNGSIKNQTNQANKPKNTAQRGDFAHLRTLNNGNEILPLPSVDSDLLEDLHNAPNQIVI